MNMDIIRFIAVPLIVVILSASFSSYLTTNAERKRRIFDKKYDLYLEFVQVVSSAVIVNQALLKHQSKNLSEDQLPQELQKEKAKLAENYLSIKMKVSLICNKEIIELFKDIADFNLQDPKKLDAFYRIMLLMRNELGLSNDSVITHDFDLLLNGK
ncbi:hypothetical protein P9D31_14610 [Bacillus haynesii]|uniref:hypothetical protein n=1 Tax=Bacillus haynesii TaxID=1925021 RepID=UPI00227F2ABF|nr:hypothetical protein [Bacillus haynesii]MCY8672605.1 hypothetical protein [Bacillus haynesii]MEC1473563.1 hypothetical protein [Bacillus haynesii]MEC1478312.1 hypothetical protein [Bacillus haynesii]MEC1486935.1 hypothetical protein [Bacillus haynesii]MEC1559815.1 hypothetical protein [Bacillus haynesii]